MPIFYFPGNLFVTSALPLFAYLLFSFSPPLPFLFPSFASLFLHLPSSWPVFLVRWNSFHLPLQTTHFITLSRRLNYFISPVFLRYPRRWPFKSRHDMVSMIEPYGKVEKLSDVQGSFSSLNTAVMKFILMFWVDLRYRYPFAYTMDYRMTVKINRRTSQLSDERLLFKMSLVRRWTTRSPFLSVSNCVCCVSVSSPFRVLCFSVDKCAFGSFRMAEKWH